MRIAAVEPWFYWGSFTLTDNAATRQPLDRWSHSAHARAVSNLTASLITLLGHVLLA
jgi:hypothetical protein